MTQLETLITVAQNVGQQQAWVEAEKEREAKGLPHSRPEAEAARDRAEQLYRDTFTPENMTTLLYASDQAAALGALAAYRRAGATLQERVDDLASRQLKDGNVRTFARADEAANCRDLVRALESNAARPPGTMECRTCRFFEDRYGVQCNNLMLAKSDMSGPLYFTPPTVHVPSFGCALHQPKEES